MHNISSLCTKSSLTGLFSRVHNSDETQLTHLKFCTQYVNKHLVNSVWFFYFFITSYCFWMLPKMIEYTYFGTPGMYLNPCHITLTPVPLLLRKWAVERFAEIYSSSLCRVCPVRVSMLWEMYIESIRWYNRNSRQSRKVELAMITGFFWNPVTYYYHRNPIRFSP